MVTLDFFFHHNVVTQAHFFHKKLFAPFTLSVFSFTVAKIRPKKESIALSRHCDPMTKID
jgi:hypothetical protein